MKLLRCHQLDNLRLGFLGQIVSQLAIRVRPLKSPVAYQIDIGASFGGGLNPYLRFGVVLPNLAPGRARSSR